MLVVEGLARTGEDGRLQPSLAESLTIDADRGSVLIKLRPNVKFHDGTPADAPAIAALLPAALKGFLGFAYGDVDHIRATAGDALEIGFRGSAPLLTEALEVTLQKPNGVSTGPFEPVPGSNGEWQANPAYYLGVPALRRVRIESYPSVRAAWAELLRDRIDMLWEVAPEALSSLENTSSISTFAFTRRYQYLLVLNSDAPSLKAVARRRALTYAIDTTAVVRNALESHGVPSTGPLWPRHWAVPADSPKFVFDPVKATSLLHGERLKLSCLIPPDAPFERLALEVKRQLGAVGVDLMPEEVSYDEISERAAKRDYEALLIELISGPTLVRPYLVWHSNGPFNWGRFGNATIDAALEQVRHTSTDDQMRAAVAGIQRAFIDDPAAVFLAWSVRARAVSKRFDVQAEEGRDVLSTMRLWRPAGGVSQASRN